MPEVKVGREPDVSHDDDYAGMNTSRFGVYLVAPHFYLVLKVSALKSFRATVRATG